MQTLTILSRKGGAGKTTVAVNLAVAATAAGRDVILVDTDTQRSASEWARLRRPTTPVVVSASGPKLFQARVSAERAGCELMIVDTPPGPNEQVIQSIQLADFCLLVVRPNFFDISALVATADLVKQLGKRSAILLNQAPFRRMGTEPPQVLRAIDALKLLGVPIAPIGFRQRTAFQTSVSQGASVQEFEPDSPAATEATGLWSYVASALADIRPATEAAARRA